MKRIAQSNNSLGVKLFSSRAREEPSGKNIFISPHSLATALAMLALGSSRESLAQLKNALEWESIESSGDEQAVIPFYSESIQELNEKKEIELLTGNSVWSREVREDYIEKLRNQFGAEVFPLESGMEINRWVAEKTRNLIKNIIDEIEPECFGVLVNVIYFKGMWQSQFKPKLTSDETFHLSDGSSKKVPTMYKCKRFPYKITDEYTAVELPYVGGNYSMIAVLPKDCNASDFSKNLTLEKLHEIPRGIRRNHKVLLYFPKFRLEYGVVEMGESLKDVGVTQIYSEGNAQLDRLSNDLSACVSGIFHKAVCIVNEEGTEAAAATAVKCVSKSMDFSETIRILIKFDRPFLFMIRERKSNLILFLGLMENPSENQQ